MSTDVVIWSILTYCLTVSYYITSCYAQCLPLPGIEALPPGFTRTTYSPSNIVLLNPGRGFVEEYSISETTFEPMTPFKLETLRVTTGSTIVLRHYLLTEYRNRTIPEDYLFLLRYDLNVVKNVGFKVIIRFSYSKHYVSGGPYGDVDKTIMKVHINQLRKIFIENQDIIYAVQAGFIGTWGEWYYTDHFGSPPLKEYKWKDRIEVLKELLSAVPKHIPVQLRTPFFKRMIYGFSPTTIYDVITREQKSRIGIHNDCFLASENDKGTYQNYTIEYDYLSKDSNYVLIGGETCELSPTGRHICPIALRELQDLHFSFLAQSYNKEVLNKWKGIGPNDCYDEIRNHLGYRLSLKQSILQRTISTGEYLSYYIILENTGYAAPIKDMEVNLILHSQLTGDFSVPIETNVKLWGPGSYIDLNGAALIPYWLPEGSYQMFLAIGERNTVTEGSDYFVLLSNEGVPLPQKGVNDLRHEIKVRKGTATQYYMPECTPFTKWTAPRSTAYPRILGSDACFKIKFTNPSFENERDWLTFNNRVRFHRNISEAYHGEGYMELIDNAAYQSLSFPEHSPVVIKKMAIRAYSRHTGEVYQNKREYSVYCDIWQQQQGNPIYGFNTPFRAQNGTTWHAALLKLTANQGMRNVNCYLRYNSFPTGSSAFFDNVQVWILSGNADFTDCDFSETVHDDYN